MTYGCGADTCLTCYPFQYACADCGGQWEQPIENGQVFTCPECDYINNEEGERMSKYTVWAGGSELNATYLNYEKAIELAKSYRGDGYEDIEIELVDWKDSK